MNRRTFLSKSGAALAVTGLRASRLRAVGPTLVLPASNSSTRARVETTPPIEAGNRFYVGNRTPLTPSPLIKLPIGAIEPHGWVRRQLLLMADGLTGRLPELSKFLEPTSGWLTLKPTDPGWEEPPYWLRGFGDLGYVLEDNRIIREARRWLDSALGSQQADGYFGPPMNKQKDDLWPNMVMLNALQSFYEWSGDTRVLPFMSRYFRYELNLPRARLLPGSWQKVRGGDNLASIYWLYNRTGEAWLLDAAKAIHERTADWTSGPQTKHGVNNTQGFREPATYYQQSRDPRFLEATERDYATVMDEYGQVPGGMFGADENFRPGHTGPSQAAETCSMVEFMHSFETLLKLTGNPLWADRAEEVAFNSLPAALTADVKALHYLTAPNLMQCDPSEDHVFQNRQYMLPFSSTHPLYRCCLHNAGMGWPYYAEHLWLATQGNGLAAVLYAPSVVQAKVGQGARVRIEEKTDYPFGEAVNFEISTPKPVRFPLHLRIPGWCQAASIRINGKRLEVDSRPQCYVVIERVWKDGDRVNLELPMKLGVKVWKKQNNAVSIHRGPLAYSLRIGHRWEKIGGTEEWPDLAVYPTTAWNIGLAVDPKNPSAVFHIVTKSWEQRLPFDLNAAPVELRARGRVIPSWTTANNSAGPLPPSPLKSDEPEQDITLVPMGFARLRVSVFPTIG